MNSRQKLTLYLFLTIVLGSIAFAQVVDIPDPNLRAAIADELNIAHDAPAFSTSVHICLSNFCPDLKLNRRDLC